jgi:tRNA pseudouridine38-40 synthase
MPLVPTRWKCVCAYDGAGFRGWQSQAGGASIQDVIEARLAQVLGAPVRTHASGRTDAGVHARGQVFHFDAIWRHGPEKLRAALRHRLPPAIQIKSIRPAPGTFHARFGATGKIYTYDLFLGEADPFVRPWCWPVARELDIAAMKRAAGVLRGRHDFKAFSAWNGAEQGDTVRHLRRFDLARRGRRLRLTFEADGFLYKMARSLAGALVAVGAGKLSVEQIGQILESRARTPAVQTAPPQGLFLQRVFYR